MAPGYAPGAPDYPQPSTVVVENNYTYWYGDYWGPAYDPYLYDLYGCRWGYGGFFAGGFVYGSGPWFFHRGLGWHDRGFDRGFDRGRNFVTGGGVVRPGSLGSRVGNNDGFNRGTVPWLRPPITTPTTPAFTGRGGIVTGGRSLPAAAGGNGSNVGRFSPQDSRNFSGRRSDGAMIQAGQAPASSGRFFGPSQTNSPAFQRGGDGSGRSFGGGSHSDGGGASHAGGDGGGGGSHGGGDGGGHGGGGGGGGGGGHGK
jgi:hypothetical protein